jgi:REP element-mobilizing transposase RayT
VTWRLHPSQVELDYDERTIVESAIRHFDGIRYTIYAWVVMNDHVHLVVRPEKGYELSSLLHTWKSYTANKFQRDRERIGPVWQDERYDRVIRNRQELMEVVKYIIDNPFRRWVDLKDYPWRGIHESIGTLAGRDARPTG